MGGGDPKPSGDSQGGEREGTEGHWRCAAAASAGTIVLRRLVLYAMVVDATEQVTARRRQE